MSPKQYMEHYHCASCQKNERPLWEELRKEVPPKTFVKPAGCD